MSELEALALRCEAASGADRLLSAEIAVAVKTAEGRVVRVSDANPRKIVENYDHGSTGVYWPRDYTDSLDDAETLVPEDALWSVGHAGDEKPGVFSSTVMPMGPSVHSYAATPALALTAAALRARAAIEPRP